VKIGILAGIHAAVEPLGRSLTALEAHGAECLVLDTNARVLTPIHVG
jgi:hypothetical protein